MKIRPELSLALLLLIGIAVSGWIYGLHWKRIAQGDKFTDEETLIIRLQDQIELLSEENDFLTRRVREMQSNEPKESTAKDREGSEKDLKSSDSANSVPRR